MRLLKLFLTFFCITESLCLTAQDLKIYDLRCEYKKNPMGLVVDQPLFSWKMAAAESEKEILQTAYQIQVVQNSPFENADHIVWDSKKSKSDQSLYIKYNGKPLEDKIRYFWRVKLWDNKKRESRWSDVQWFEMGIRDSSNWQAIWISPQEAYDIDRKNPPTYLRKEFNLKDKPVSAKLYISAQGLFLASINGQEITQEIFNPGWTSYNHRIQYKVYDVVDLINQGDNATGVILGEGWYRGNLGWSGLKFIYGQKLALLYQLELTYEDGSIEIVKSDPTWKSTDQGPIRYSSIYNGEIYDANFELDNWDVVGYDAQQWTNVEPIQTSFSKLTGSIGPAIERIDEVRPVSILTTPKGEKVIDFGQNIVGRVRISLPGEEGKTITLDHAEVLDKDGNFYIENLRSADQKDQYTFGNNETIVYEPHFTFHGFRYVKISGYNLPLQPEYFTGIVIHSQMEKTGAFETSDTLINQLQHNIVWGQKGNFLDVPTDCPQRDERMGWTGDAQVFASTACYNFNTAGFFNKWYKDIEADQRSNGSIPFVVPDLLGGPSGQGGAGSTGWGDVATVLPWTVYQKFGDRRILETAYDNMKNWISFLHSLSGDNYLVQEGFHFGDWLFFIHPTEWNVKPGYTDIDFIATAFFAYSASIVANTAKILEKDADVSYYNDLFNKIKNAFQKEYVTNTGRLSPHSQTAYTLALHFNLLNETQAQGAIHYLVQNIEGRDFHLSTGFLGTPYLCHVLSKYGYADVAYKLLKQKTYPSWLYPITRGATTIWERWDGIKPDSSFQSVSMNSFNHYAYGAIGDWMYSEMAGLKALAPGYKEILIAPSIDPSFSYVKASLDSPYGMIISQWKIENDQLILDVTIPPNTTATIKIPPAFGISAQTVGSGKYQFSYSMEGL